MPEQPRMNKDPEFLARKRRRVREPHVQPLNALIERWRHQGHPLPWTDPDSGGIHVMGGFAEHWWLRYLRQDESPVLPLITAPHPAAGARRGRPDFQREISVAMIKARKTAS